MTRVLTMCVSELCGARSSVVVKIAKRSIADPNNLDNFCSIVPPPRVSETKPSPVLATKLKQAVHPHFLKIFRLQKHAAPDPVSFASQDRTVTHNVQTVFFIISTQHAVLSFCVQVCTCESSGLRDLLTAVSLYRLIVLLVRGYLISIQTVGSLPGLTLLDASVNHTTGYWHEAQGFYRTLQSCPDSSMQSSPTIITTLVLISSLILGSSNNNKYNVISLSFPTVREPFLTHTYRFSLWP